jgi:streptomycin 3"-adenylyltransferase
LAAPVRLEVSFLSRPSLIPWRYPSLLDYHFSQTNEVRDRLTTYLAAEVANARARGVALVGPPPEDVLPAVPASDFLDSLVRDLAWARDRVEDAPIYAVLNCCRVLAYARERVILSKSEGGEWALGKLPGRFRPLAQAALDAYRAEPRDDEAFDAAEVRRFTEWVEQRL